MTQGHQGRVIAGIRLGTRVSRAAYRFAGGLDLRAAWICGMMGWPLTRRSD